MWSEIAVDPNCFSSWNDYQLVFPRFGIHMGRLISEFPDDWIKLARIEIVRSYRKNRIKEIERQKLINKLERIKIKMFEQSRNYNYQKSWILNAIDEDEENQFDAIISKINPTGIDRVIKIIEIDEDNELWKDRRQIVVERNFNLISSMLSKLFSLSKKIILVDPHFNPTRQKYQISLESILDEICNYGLNIQDIEYHIVGDPMETTSQFERSCNCYLPPLFPTGKQIKFIRWSSQQASDPGAGGKRLHPRFILSDVGGVSIDWGLDEGQPGDRTTITILNPEVYKIYWELHHKNASTYVFVDEIIICGNK